MSNNGPAMYGPSGGASSAQISRTDIFDVSGSYADPGAQFNRFRVRVWGAGGDGGTCSGFGVQVGSGGGAGGYAEIWLTRDDAPLPWTINVAASAPDTSYVLDAGAAVPVAAESGTDGAATVSDSTLLVVGGIGGYGVVGAQILFQGETGGAGQTDLGSTYNIGKGGAAPFGGAGGPRVEFSGSPLASIPGVAGSIPGGGGSGAFKHDAGIGSVSGGSGARGMIIVEAYS